MAALFLDLMVSTLASLLAILLLRWVTAPVLEFGHFVYVWVLFGFLSGLLGILVTGTNRIVIKHTTIQSVGKILGTTLIKDGIMFLLILSNLFHFGNQPRADVLLLVFDLLLTLTMLIITRLLVIAVYNDLKDSPEKKVDRIPIMIYGTSDKSVAMVVRLENSIHYDVVGYLTRDTSKTGLVAMDVRIYSFRNEEDVESLKILTGFQGVIFPRDEDSMCENGEEGLLLMCLHHGIQCLTAPKIDQINISAVSKGKLNSVVNTSVDYIPDGMSAFERNVKRLVDFILSSILLVVFSPLFLICYIALKLDDGGPAIYKQERIGRFGRPFNIYKFRSMRTDAEAAGPALFAGDDDPRLTRVGGFLRRHHLDELPQLFNVWRGDMAFIGPRPERKFYIDQIMEQDPRYYFLYQIRPGVTSYATLRNGYTDTMEKMLRRLEFDLYYLRHRSWWFDIKILWQTFINIVFGKVF